jgi:glycerophosphoryl diester phosphodiesterase
MKKRVILFLTICLAILFIGSFNQFEVSANTESVRTITSTSTHVLGDVNVPIDTTKIKVSGTFGEIFLNEATLTSSNPSVTIAANSVTISEKGIFPVSFNYSSTNMTLHFITKLESEEEYVIYQEDFTGVSNGALPSSLTLLNNVGQSGGAAAIDNQRLFLGANTIVLFPSYLQGFTNYIIETDMRMASASSDTRWTSVLFRYETENYFQMAIRQNATAANGVEFAKRISGNWNVPKTASYSEALATNKTYNLKIDVFNTNIKQYIDSQELITYDSAFEFTHGRIGVQANDVTVYYDNIRITLPKDYVEVERYQFQSVVDVYQPTTNIVAPATTIAWFDHTKDLSDYTGSIRPATLVFRINSNLEIVDNNGNVIMPMLDALIEIDGKVIPAFYTNDIDTARNLALEIKASRIFDLFLISESKDVILAAREENSVIRGVLNFKLQDIDNLSFADLLDIRRETNQAQAVAAILPNRLINQEKVFYMQHRLMTVWVTAEDDDISQYRAILSGANGIVTDSYLDIFDKYQEFGPTTHVRKPLMIAHRGLFNGGTQSPENTVESALVAIEKGADVLEIDVHITLDEEVYVLHDNTTARTAPDFPSITIAQDFSYNIENLILRDPLGLNNNIRIPKLSEFLSAVKGTGVVVFIEIKPTNNKLVELVAEIVEELDMYDQSVVITFNANNIIKMNEVYPDMANGLLTGAVLNAASVNTSLTNVFSTIVPINSTLNPSYGALTEPFINALIHRGVTVWPWTLNVTNDLVTYYNLGANGLTTDFIQYVENTFDRITMKSVKHEELLANAADIKLTATIETPNGTSYPYMPEYHVVTDGGTGITLNAQGRVLSATNVGSAYYFAEFTSSMPNGASFTVLSDLIEIRLYEESVEPEPTPEPSDPTPEPSDPTPEPSDPTPEPDDESRTLLIVVASVGGSATLGAMGYFGFRWFKLRKLL